MCGEKYSKFSWPGWFFQKLLNAFCDSDFWAQPLRWGDKGLEALSRSQQLVFLDPYLLNGPPVTACKVQQHTCMAGRTRECSLIPAHGSSAAAGVYPGPRSQWQWLVWEYCLFIGGCTKCFACVFCLFTVCVGSPWHDCSCHDSFRIALVGFSFLVSQKIINRQNHESGMWNFTTGPSF